MSGPTYSNREFRCMKPLRIDKGQSVVIEVWPGSDWDDTKGCAIPVPGAKDIKVYERTDNKDKYNKGEQLLFMRVFDNAKPKQTPF